MASTIMGLPYLISSATPSSPPGALLCLILFITLPTSSHKRISTFLSSSSPSLLKTFEKLISKSSFLFRSSLKCSAHLPISFSSLINFPFLCYIPSLPANILSVVRPLPHKSSSFHSADLVALHTQISLLSFTSSIYRFYLPLTFIGGIS